MAPNVLIPKQWYPSPDTILPLTRDGSTRVIGPLRIGSLQSSNNILFRPYGRILALALGALTVGQAGNLRTAIGVAEERDGLPGGCHRARTNRRRNHAMEGTAPTKPLTNRAIGTDAIRTSAVGRWTTGRAGHPH
jgi:hypothetical protein